MACNTGVYLLDWTVRVLGDDCVTPVSAANPFPVTVVGGSSHAGSFTDRSGTITLGGTAQTLAAANASRVYLFIQNVSNDGDMWINFGTTAVQNQPSIRLVPTASFELGITDFVSTELISIIGPTTAAAFTAKEA